MAFVLVALMILFGLILVSYTSIKISQLNKEANRLGEEQATEMVKKIVSSPEFIWAYSSCSLCIDMDKVFILKNRSEYRDFWNVDFLIIEKITKDQRNRTECNLLNYPNCTTITLIKKDNADIGIPKGAFVSLCRHENDRDGYTRCELGKIYAYPKKIK